MRSALEFARQRLLILMWLAVASLVATAGLAVFETPSFGPYPFLHGLRPASIEIVDVPGHSPDVEFSFFVDRNVDDVLAESNRDFGGADCWKGDNYKQDLICAKSGWKRFEPGHVAGCIYSKGGVDVEITFWYKVDGDPRAAAEPPNVTISRPATLIDRLHFWATGFFSHSE